MRRGENHIQIVFGWKCFQHKRIHRLTWTSPDGKTESQLYHYSYKWKMDKIPTKQEEDESLQCPAGDVARQWEQGRLSNAS